MAQSTGPVSDEFAALLRRVAACDHCAAHLPLGPRPVVRAARSARLVIVGQAPGTKVHVSGRPFTDPSGHRLRNWLGVGKAEFYDPERFAILPAGLCYPGRNPRGGDLPPVSECGPHWHSRLRPLLPDVRLTVLVGRYAHELYLGPRAGASVARTVASWREYAPDLLPTPHPSWRVNGWLRRNPWFEAEVLLVLRARVAAAISP